MRDEAYKMALNSWKIDGKESIEEKSIYILMEDKGSQKLVKTRRPEISENCRKEVTRLWTRYNNRLASFNIDSLIAEVGELSRTGTSVGSSKYELVRGDGMLFYISSPYIKYEKVLWQKHADEESPLPADSTLLLAPSAALSIAYAMKDCNADLEVFRARISIDSSPLSPYPPHSMSGLMQKRLGVMAITNPYAWHQPLGALQESWVGGIDINCSNECLIPDKAILLETATQLNYGSSGQQWEAAFSVYQGNGEWHLGRSLLQISLNAIDLLSCVVGRGAEQTPALVDDPIQGQRYGNAPIVVTNTTLDRYNWRLL